MGNRKELIKAVYQLDKAKAPKKPKDIITDPMGQWKYPGQPTRIPGSDITMQGVNYPVMAVASTGQKQMMLPGAEYSFPGADYVDEFPQMKKGGGLKRGTTKSLSGTNKLMRKNPLFKNYKHKLFDPKSKHFQDGGEYIEAELTPEEIEEYRKGGFIVEDISVPSLNQRQEGGSKKLDISINPTKQPPAFNFIPPRMPGSMQEAQAMLDSGELKERSNPFTKEEAKLAKLALNIIGTRWYPAAVASSIWDAYDGDYAAAALGLIPGVGTRGNYGKYWGKAYTKAINAGVPHSIAYPAKKYGKAFTVGNSIGFSANNIYNDIKDVVEEKANGGPVDNKNKPLSFEQRVDKSLGFPARKGAEDAEIQPWYNPKTKKFEKEEPIDNVRHASAGRYTAEAISNKLSDIPFMPKGIANTMGYLGANALGIGHELSLLPEDERWSDSTAGNILQRAKTIGRESLEDIYNNAVGANVGAFSGMSSNAKRDYIRKLSEENKIPDGFGEVDPFKKGLTNKYSNKKAYGGYMQEGGENKEVPINAANPYLILDEGEFFKVRPLDAQLEYDRTNQTFDNRIPQSGMIEQSDIDPADIVSLGAGLAKSFGKGIGKSLLKSGAKKLVTKSITPIGYDPFTIAAAPLELLTPKALKFKPKTYATKNRYDAWKLYNGLEPEFNTFSKNLDGTLAINDFRLAKHKLQNIIDNPKKSFGTTDIENEFNFAGVHGNGWITKGVDEEGKKFIDFTDTWDLQPLKNVKGLPDKVKEFEVSSLTGGKPFDLKNRIYYDDAGNFFDHKGNKLVEEVQHFPKGIVKQNEAVDEIMLSTPNVVGTKQTDVLKDWNKASNQKFFKGAAAGIGSIFGGMKYHLNKLKEKSKKDLDKKAYGGFMQEGGVEKPAYEIQLPELTITPEEEWQQQEREYIENNPKSKDIDKYLTPFARGLGNTETNYPERLDEEYAKKIDQYIAQQTFKNNPIKKGESRGEYLDRLVSRKDKKGNKYTSEDLNAILHSNLGESDATQENLYNTTKTGFKALTESNIVDTYNRILKDKSLSASEKEEMLRSYMSNPMLSKVGEAAGVLSPLSIPYNATFGNLYSQQQGEKGYNWKKALAGQSPKYQNTMLSTVADPLELAGVGLIDDFGRLGKSGLKNIGKKLGNTNLEDLTYAKKWAKQYGYELPKNLERIAKSDELTNKTIRGLMNRHNSFTRGVSTNWDVIGKKNPKVLKYLKDAGIDYANNPKAAAEYMATHIPGETGYGRYGLEDGEHALYLSNSNPTGEAYTYGQGYNVKVKRPTDFSSANRKDWITNNQFFANKEFKGSEYGKGIVKNDYIKRIPIGLRETLAATGDPNKMAEIQKIVQEKEALYNDLSGQSWRKYNDKIDDLKYKTDPVYRSKFILPDAEDKFFLRNSPNIIDKINFKYLNTKKDLAQDYYNYLPYLDMAKGVYGDPDVWKALGKNMFGKIDPFSHYAIKGQPGEKVLETIRSKEITPESWNNKSRAHINLSSKGLTRRKNGGWLNEYQGGGVTTNLRIVDEEEPTLSDEEFFNQPTENEISDKPARSIYISDPRKIRATTGKKIRPNVDLKSGEYDVDAIEKLAEYAVLRGINPYRAIAQALAESTLGTKTPDNVGHTRHGKNKNMYTNMMDAIIEGDSLAKVKGKTKPEEIIQGYNRYGKLTSDTEKDYHGYKAAAFYGVPIPKKTGYLDMNKTPLYGIEVLDLQKNVLEPNEKVRSIVQSQLHPRPPKLTIDYFHKNRPEFSKGGVVAKLSQKEIDDYIKQGYIVEEE